MNENENELYCFIYMIVYTYKEFVIVTEATAVQQNDSNRIGHR